MTSSKLEVENPFELLALHRGLLEARFCDVANDADVSGSPILADLHRRLIEVLVNLVPPVGGTREQWRSWLVLDKERREWTVAINRARQSSWWAKLTPNEKHQACLDLLAPFEVSPALVELFVAVVDQQQARDNPVPDS